MSKNIDLYKGQAEKYHKFSQNSFSWEYIEKVAFDKYLKSLYKKNLKVLDVGSGGGRIIKYLISNGINPKNIVGVDSNHEMIEIAKKDLPSVNFVHSDISKAKFKKSSFDLITSSMTLHHLDRTAFRKTTRKFYDWLASGGTLFFIIVHPSRWGYTNFHEYFERNKRLMESAWGTKISYFHRTVSDYVNELIKDGFKIDFIDEPEPSASGKKYMDEYRKYASYPHRLVIRASK